MNTSIQHPISMILVRALVSLIALSTAWSCSDPEDESTTTPETTAGMPTGGETPAVTAGMPTGGEPVEAGTEAGSEAGTEAGAEAGVEAGAEAGAEAGTPAQMTPEAPATPPESCEAFGSTSCFANNECFADGRCQSVGTPDLPLACCVAGERGTDPVGTACSDEDGERTCASSLCIYSDLTDESLCSGECTSDADCPENLPRCFTIAFSGSDSMWCSPPAPGEE